ncbi:hypothetical protein SS1G_09946 [Sclerotinia sclerotiorum 1980 UF-70]|uniref:SRP54-type proteins GTP-binding domain-containing protein n=2 Tax=Sclerotinia sclerotiorum (strain ATCC 18683 / 1980 / Ss-1) TaxID=665079 RepID=A7EX86_SCLS1|nr:hypothetical protein SS1G_09946 [Sclerotinia sclerotiorum 1980 UF-70]APA05505.1 hypothetical protein sscle_01g002750 [Sclerotinia sclerotiorum 1980 UF-70]EDN94078.1 hypothetical protein SS1G_09946 [Sclerotinia sclerotiorum 1980 UF-70]
MTTTKATKPQIIDDKTAHILPFILHHLSIHQKAHATRPFVIGLNGIQGAGKTTLVNTLYEILTRDHGLETLVLSIDDLYLTREDQEKLARENKENKLVRFRGEPGTHDIPLANALFTSLLQSPPKTTHIPIYDKSLHSGLGDRSPNYHTVNNTAQNQKPIQIIIFEGWCVGFRSLPPTTISEKHQQSLSLPANSKIYTTLRDHPLSSLHFINQKLQAYDTLTNTFNIFIHLDAQDTQYVYEWRQEQEEALRRKKGSGMTDEQVKEFVDAYYPAYELFLDVVRGGIFKGRGVEGELEGEEEGEKEWEGKQLRLVVGKDRRVVDVETI